MDPNAFVPLSIPGPTSHCSRSQDGVSPGTDRYRSSAEGVDVVPWPHLAILPSARTLFGGRHQRHYASTRSHHLLSPLGLPFFLTHPSLIRFFTLPSSFSSTSSPSSSPCSLVIVRRVTSQASFLTASTTRTHTYAVVHIASTNFDWVPSVSRTLPTTCSF